MKMTWQFALAAVAFLQHCAARGLKGLPSYMEGSDGKQLEAENEDLKKRNRHLEAMMQVARNEVHRLDVESKKHANDKVDVLTQENEVLKKQLLKAQADKKSLAQTLRQLLAKGKNSTKVIRKQAENAARAKQAVETKCSNERAALQAQIKEITGRCDEVKEVSMSLQDSNMDLKRTVQDLQAKLSKTEQVDKELSVDKANLMATMHNLMRESDGYKKELKREKQKEDSLTKEVAADKALFAKLSKSKPKQLKPAAAKDARKLPVKRTGKTAPMHLSHEESMASKMAKMKDINRYIDRANMPEIPSDENDDTRQADEQSKQDVFTRGELQIPQDLTDVYKALAPKHPSKAVADAVAPVHHDQGVNNWLDLKATQEKLAAEDQGPIPKDANGLSPIDALDPDAVKQEKAAQEQKEKASEDDGGDGIENLLAQAKDQLSAMDEAESQNF